MSRRSYCVVKTMASTLPVRSSRSHGRPQLAVLVALALDAGQDAANGHLGAALQAFQRFGGVRGKLRHLVGVFIQRMAGDVDAEHFLLARQLLLRGPIRAAAASGCSTCAGSSATMPNNPAWPLCAILPRPLAALHGALDHGRQLRAIAAQAAHGAALDQVFEDAPVHAGSGPRARRNRTAI